MIGSSWLVVALVMAGASPRDLGGAERCLPCHEKETPGAVATWRASAHARAKVPVGCAGCHGADGPSNHPAPGARTRPAVDAAVCAKCHAGRAAEHARGPHGTSLRSGRGCTRNVEKPGPGCSLCHQPGSTDLATQSECARFLTQSPAMQRQGCSACHEVERRCDACHGTHGTAAALARDPATCGTCHMGPDHPQYEMWKSSRHGVRQALEGRAAAPDCATCHMPAGAHDVGRGITMGLAGQPFPEARRKAERERMLDVCAKCHARGLAARQLADGDAVQRESKALLEEAAAIVKRLDDQGLLEPSPSARPAHPLAGKRLELGAQMLYEDLSRAEAIFFRMKKYAYVTAYKGVFHQNPDYAHWYGNAALKLGLSELKSEAALLQRIRRLEQRLDAAPPSSAATAARDPVERELRELREKRLRGELDDAALERRQLEALERPR
ncbi:MAG TPA: multiheme c-type cytochrome [Anaeromyxobacteraceae bacterium]|nr:multiheme c-type cytochrome [Anaeromyxobacteraceae bacterium]